MAAGTAPHPPQILDLDAYLSVLQFTFVVT